MIQNFNLSKKKQSVLPYLSFTGTESFTLKTYNGLANWNGTIEYSVDTINWTIWDGTEISSSSNVLYLRGSNNTYVTGSIDDNLRFVFTTNGYIDSYGDIEALLDYTSVQNGVHPIFASNAFCRLFKNCTSLKTAPSISSPYTAISCYQQMFQGCTSLTEPTELPSTSLSSKCYTSMFEGCTALLSAPLLPAIILVNDCYSGLFKSCTSLTVPPALPAETLADYCYQSMFYGCTHLIKLPALPAIALIRSCYNQMFYGCSLIKISQTQTDEYINEYRIPTVGTGSGSSTYMSSMFSSTGGTFTSTPSINITYYTSNEIVPAS